MPVAPRSIDDLFRYQTEIARELEAARIANNAADVARLTSLIKEVNSAIRRGALSGMAGQVAIISDLARKIEALTQDTAAWPFGNAEAPEEHERSFGEQLPENDFMDEGPTAAAPVSAAVDAAAIPVVSADWASNYKALWEAMEIVPDRMREARAIAAKIVANQGRYATAVLGTKVPWWFLAVAHAMECSLRFDQHPHNGDPLTARTVRVPKNRPAFGAPPFSWEDSAADALKYERLDAVTDWSVPSALFHWHRYNGINNEYKRRNIPTPYLWSGTQHYRKGKYVADHQFDPEAISKQMGAATLLRALIDLNAVELATKQRLAANPVAAVGSVAALSLDVSTLPDPIAAEVNYPGPISAAKPGKNETDIRRLQEWLCLHDFTTPIDGGFGQSTGDQLRAFQASVDRVPTGELDPESWALLTAPLRRALAPIDHGLAPTLEQSVIRVAQQHMAQRPTEIGGNNRGPWVRVYMAGLQGVEQKWCAGFISTIISQAARDLKTAMPFKRQVGVDALVADAKETGRFVKENEVPDAISRRSRLRPGDLFVVRQSSSDWTHVGILLDPKDSSFDTLEGNTEVDGGNDGANARQGNRSYTGKDFIHLL
ncbi:MAG: peptidoglycan-binding protein [Devosia sp.]